MSTRLSKRGKRIAKDYLSETWQCGEPVVTMRIGVQGFSIQSYSNTKRSKTWMRKMLANALDKFLELEGVPK
jgi:hypothetical protein